VAALEQPADLVDVEGPLGDQDHVGAAGEPRVERDPARVPAHHLDDEDPVVALGRRVEAVDRLGRDVDRGVEAERQVGRAEVVVDRLRDPQHRQPVVVVEAGGGAERVLAADRDQRVEVEPRERLADPVGPVVTLERVRARGAEDRPAARQDPARRLDRQLVVGALERAAPAVAEADDRVAVVVDPLAHDRADRRVQPRAVAAACQHSNSHRADDTRAQT
jgi:hypothetical protein